jgi:murein DD-endopeptidase MepM/ murein hydrolase activator NlpD
MRGWASVWLALALVFLLAPSPEAQGGRAPGAGASGSKRSRARPVHPVPAPGVPYTVRAGDTLWSIAREHGVTVEALRRANRLAPNARLRVGQPLYLALGSIRPDQQEPPSFADIVLDRPPPTPLVSFIRPVPGPVGSPFGPRNGVWHGGVDLRAERGAPVRAAAAGMVIMSGWERGYGKVVKIWHAGDLMTVYAHNHENLVKVGDWVEQGTVIATVGATGHATAPHLHFEIRLDGRKYDPLFWLPEGEIREAAADGARGAAVVR